MRFTTVLAISVAALVSTTYALPTAERVSAAVTADLSAAADDAHQMEASFIAGEEEEEVESALERRSPEPKKNKKKKGKKGKKGKKKGGKRTCATFSDSSVACCKGADCANLFSTNGGTVGDTTSLREQLDGSGKNVCGSNGGSKVCCEQGTSVCGTLLPGKGNN